MKNGELNKCNYFMENSKYTNFATSFGFFLESPHSKNNYQVWSVGGYSRHVNYINNDTTSYGVRPVIELNKNDIEI